MTATETGSATYRKTKSGEWVVFAPVNTLRAGATTKVAKRDGATKTETIARVGRPFTVDGREMAYGYIAAQAARSTRPATRRNSRGDAWLRDDSDNDLFAS